MIEPTPAGPATSGASEGTAGQTAGQTEGGGTEQGANGSNSSGGCVDADCEASGGGSLDASGSTTAGDSATDTASGGTEVGGSDTSGPQPACVEACGPGGVCEGGACLCFGQLSLCDGSCVDTQRDPDNCGGCGESCGDDVCRLAECEDDCDDDTPNECDGSCTDVVDDIFNCGECGNVCTAGEVCVGGTCDAFEATACDSCPCDACGDAQCCGAGYFGFVGCVDGPACPA